MDWNLNFQFTIDLTDAYYVKDSEVGNGKYYYFDSLKVYKDDKTIVIFDDFSGQIRQYNEGILFMISVAEYDKTGKSYKQYPIRTEEECKKIALILQLNKEELNRYDYKIWNMTSGETFID